MPSASASPTSFERGGFLYRAKPLASFCGPRSRPPPRPCCCLPWVRELSHIFYFSSVLFPFYFKFCHSGWGIPELGDTTGQDRSGRFCFLSLFSLIFPPPRPLLLYPVALLPPHTLKLGRRGMVVVYVCARGFVFRAGGCFFLCDSQSPASSHAWPGTPRNGHLALNFAAAFIFYDVSSHVLKHRAASQISMSHAHYRRTAISR